MEQDLWAWDQTQAEDMAAARGMMQQVFPARSGDAAIWDVAELDVATAEDMDAWPHTPPEYRIMVWFQTRRQSSQHKSKHERTSLRHSRNVLLY